MSSSRTSLSVDRVEEANLFEETLNEVHDDEQSGSKEIADSGNFENQDEDSLIVKREIDLLFDNFKNQFSPRKIFLESIFTVL